MQNAPPNFPFSAVVGQNQLKIALLLISIDPKIGGVLLRGARGSAKSTMVRSLAGLIENQPFVNLPLGASEEMISGSFDLGKALSHAEFTFLPGLLAKANNGILYVDEVNLLADNLVDLLLDVSASGVNVVERDGISHQHDAHFSLIGTMNPDEGELRPQLLDRFGLSAEVETVFSLAQRKQIVQQRLAYDRDADDFTHRHQIDEDALRDKLTWAKTNLSAVLMPDSISEQIAQRCADADVEGFRADLTMHRASCANAAFNQRLEVSVADLNQVAPLVLAHRWRSSPHKQPVPPNNGGSPGNTDDSSTNPSGHRGGSSLQGSWGATDTVSTATAAERVIPRPAATLLHRIAKRMSNTESICAAKSNLHKGESRSRRFSSQPSPIKRKIDWCRTLGMNMPFASLNYHDKQRGLKFRYPKAVAGELDLVLLDISASTLSGQGLSHAKGALKALSQRSYLQRRHLSIITFGNDRVCTLLHPQRAPKNLQDKLDAIRAGGGTPVEQAFNYAENLLNRQRYRHFDCAIFLLTDGRLNQSASHHPLLSAYPITIVDIESSRIKLAQGRQLAAQISAQYVHVAELPLA